MESDKTTPEEKRVYLSLWIDPGLKKSFVRLAKKEGRSLSNTGNRLLEWCLPWLDRAGGTQSLKEWEARPRVRRVSEETIEQLHVALDTIIDRAPSTVIEDLTNYLTSRAGKFGCVPESRHD